MSAQVANAAVVPAPFAAFVCDPPVGGDHDLARELRARGSSLKLAVPVDHLTVTRVSGTEREPVAVVGDACSGASDAAACQKALDELVRAAPASTPCDSENYRCIESVYAVTTTGDAVKLWTSPEQMRELLGEIDSPSEAWVLAQAKEHEPPYLCDDEDSSAQRTIEGGYELRVRRYTKGCRPLEKTELVYRIGRDGAVERLSSKVIESNPDACMTR
jgi:hypothetical protein